MLIVVIATCYFKDIQMFPKFTLNLILSGKLLPRVQKNKEQQKTRTKVKAEVFTPSWVCNKMNNYCDDEWFERNNVFNTENADNTWTPNKNKIEFGPQKQKRYSEWQRYVISRRIEITCGEAPYLVSRYDTTTGEYIEIDSRIGIVDRKLRVICENTKTESEWLKWAYKAFESSYGYEWQEDNLFFARVNMVQTFIDYYEYKFATAPSKQIIKKIANIVSWNLWQMDGLKDTSPYGIPEDEFEQMSLFDKESDKKTIYCKVKDWRNDKTIEFRSLKGGEAS